MKDNNVGSIDNLWGTLDGTKCISFLLRKPTYVMKLMGVYGGPTARDVHHEVWWYYMDPDF